MNSFREAIRSWFGYSRRERRSTFILLIIIVIILGIRYLYPSQQLAMKELPEEFLEKRNIAEFIEQDTTNAGLHKFPSKKERKRSVLNLNSCDSADLEALPGIGPVLSARIIKYRNLIGGYVTAEQLKEVYGLQEETFNMISGLVKGDSLSLRKLNINEADYKQLIRHPYLQKNEVTAILKYRELKGSISGIELMVGNNLISNETARKIGVYLDF
jgi:DNA uptake protein ComE-like DNA-binding protein